MLFLRKRSERLSREARADFERMVEAVHIGYLISRSEKAAAAWRRRLQATATAPSQSVDQYRATVARLARLTNRGRPLGLVN